MVSQKTKATAVKAFTSVQNKANAVGPYALATLGAAVGVDYAVNSLETIVNVPTVVEHGLFYGSLAGFAWGVLRPVYQNGLWNAGRMAVNAVYNFRKPKRKQRKLLPRSNIRTVKKDRREFGDSPKRRWIRSSLCTAGLIGLLSTPGIKNHTNYIVDKTVGDIGQIAHVIPDTLGDLWDKLTPGKTPSVVPGPANYAKMYDQLQFSTPAMQEEAERVATFIDTNKRSYVSVAKRTGVPWFVVGAIHYRESSGRFDTYLHNGETLGRKTKLVPKGILFHNWDDAAMDAMKRYYIENQNKYGTIEAIERYNGLGYRNRTCNGRQVQSPYLWGGTDWHKGGRYVADHDFRCVPAKRPGAMAVIKAMEQKGYIPRQHF